MNQRVAHVVMPADVGRSARRLLEISNPPHTASIADSCLTRATIVAIVQGMRRTALEARLRALGYAPLPDSKRGHVLWISRYGKVAVPQTEIILDNVAAAIIAAVTNTEEE